MEKKREVTRWKKGYRRRDIVANLAPLLKLSLACLESFESLVIHTH